MAPKLGDNLPGAELFCRMRARMSTSGVGLGAAECSKPSPTLYRLGSSPKSIASWSEAATLTLPVMDAKSPGELGSQRTIGSPRASRLEWIPAGTRSGAVRLWIPSSSTLPWSRTRPLAVRA
ncbi:MAG: hypothetical protein HY319_26675 [Armatimonadetes bacterium]|nr:hypothetical protein [Armatimonadota bacterium]